MSITSYFKRKAGDSLGKALRAACLLHSSYFVAVDEPSKRQKQLAEKNTSASSLAAAIGQQPDVKVPVAAAAAGLDPDVFPESIHASWVPFMATEAKKPYFVNLQQFLKERRERCVVTCSACQLYPHSATARKCSPLPIRFSQRSS